MITNSPTIRKIILLLSVLVTVAVIWKVSQMGLSRKQYYRLYESGMPDSATTLDIILFHQWNNLGACRNVQFIGGRMLGSNLDGQKAVCMDDKIKPRPGNCLIYSFGVWDDISFDRGMLDYGCEVHAFDPNVEEPSQQGSKKISFYKMGVSGKDSKNKDVVEMKTLKSIMEMLGHTNRVIDILKMDIEGGEYKVLEDMLESGVYKKVKQLAVETHTHNWDEYPQKFKVLLNVERSGFIRFSSQTNHFVLAANRQLNISDSHCYELAWFNKKFL